MGRTSRQRHFTYPNMISPIYFLDTFQIQKPIVIYLDSHPYITTDSILMSADNIQELKERKGVVRYLTENLACNKTWDYIKIYNNTRKTDRRSFYAMRYQNEFLYIEDNLIFRDSVQGVATYRFRIEPQNFLLTVITKQDSLITSQGGTGNLANDVILGVEYSTDYMLAIAPLFSKKNRKILNQQYVDKYLKK